MSETQLVKMLEKNTATKHSQQVLQVTIPWWSVMLLTYLCFNCKDSLISFWRMLFGEEFVGGRTGEEKMERSEFFFLSPICSPSLFFFGFSWLTYSLSSLSVPLFCHYSLPLNKFGMWHTYFVPLLVCWQPWLWCPGPLMSAKGRGPGSVPGTCSLSPSLLPSSIPVMFCFIFLHHKQQHYR